MNTNIPTNLHNVLAHLYPDENSIRRIIVDSGLSLSHIALNSSPINNWSAVLTEAEKVNRVGPLLDVVEREYSNNREFRDACNRYHLSVNETVDKMDDNERCSGQANGQLTDDARSSTAFKQIHDLESPYGTMKPDSAFYVIRQADFLSLNYFNHTKATTIYVQSPRQMGKSSLMQRTVFQLRQQYGLKTAFIDFENFTEAQLSNLDDFLIELCSMIGDALDIPEEIDKYWSSARRSALIKCSNYLSKHLIPTLNQPFILAMDEVERILGTPFQNDFFGMLRTWHNDRAHNPNFAKMSLFLSSSTEPQLFIDNPNQSPFNVAEPIILYDFDITEVQQLNQSHPVQLTQNQLVSLTDLLNGHPFLTRLALYLIATRRYDFATLQQTATFEDGPFGNHLSYFWQKISDSKELQQALQQICRHQTYPADKLYYRLKGAGLVKRIDKQVVMRNQLYERYFSERLNV